MIFLILGTQKFSLNRLLEKMDELIENGSVTERVFAQIGHSDYKPQHFDYVKFMKQEDFQKKISSADLIITHSGVGSIVTALEYHKPIIVFPRLAKYREHVDDHQMEIAEAFEKRGYVLCCLDETDLMNKICKAKKFAFHEYISQTQGMIEIIRNFLDAI